MGRIFIYEIPTIPDCSHHRLITMYGANVREHIFRANEHLLRMISNFSEGQLAFAIRFLFDPRTDLGLQKRLQIQLAIKINDGVSDQIVKQLVEVGPLSEFYQKLCNNPDCRAVNEMAATNCSNCLQSFAMKKHRQFDLEKFSHVCEIVRQEDRVQAEVPRELNRYVPSSGFYYSPFLFEARPENDYLMLDSVLSKMEEPCVTELLVAPVDHTTDLQAHDKYVRRLMAVNQYGDDVYLGEAADKISANLFAEDVNYQRAIPEQGKKKDPMADEVLREQQEFHRQLRHPQLLFHIKAFAKRPENALMLASAIAESGFSEGKYQLLAYGKDSKGKMKTWLGTSYEDSKAMRVSLHAMFPKIWSANLPKGWSGLSRLNRLATVNELTGIIRLPIGGYGSPRSIRKSTDPETSKIQGTLLIGDDLESEVPAERIFSKNLSDTFDSIQTTRLETRLNIENLLKHTFISGVTGSGKTVAVFNILVQLFRQGVPFLVIEPAKTEYRILKTLHNHPDLMIQELARKLRIYTPGNDTISPMKFNPLSYPDGITRDEHIEQLLACFEAAMPMGGPLQALIGEAVEEVYQASDSENFPRMMDLLEATRRIMESKNYEGEIKSNLQAAIEVRLGSLTRRAVGRIFQYQTCIPSVKELLKYPTIIEMDYLHPDRACLLTLFLLAAIREQIKVDSERSKPGLHHATVIEEAHNIVGRTGEAKASEEIADPKAFASQYVSRMLVEMRALGEGIIISDQLPSAVASEVVKNTGTKLAYRMVSDEDREYLGGTMLMGSTELEEIARISPGEAYFYTEDLYRPRRIRTLNAKNYLQLGRIPFGTAISTCFLNDDWFLKGREERGLHALTMILSYMVMVIDRMGEIAQLLIPDKPGSLIPYQVNLADSIEDPDRRAERLQQIINTLVEAQNKVEYIVVQDFGDKIMQPLLSTIQAAQKESVHVRKLALHVEELYRTEIGEPYSELYTQLGTATNKIRQIL